MKIPQPPPVAAPAPISVTPPLVQPRRNPLLQILESSKVKTDSILEAPNQRTQDYYHFANATSQANPTSPSAAIHRPESELLLGFLRKGPVSSNAAPPPPGLQLAGSVQPTFQAAIAGSEDLSKQKSQALLSLLRTQSVTSPAPKATTVTRTSSASIDLTEPLQPSAPLPPVPNPPPTPAPTLTSSIEDEIGGSAAAVPLAPAVNPFPQSAKKSFCYRVTKNQVGKLRMVVRRGGQQGSNNSAHKSGSIAHEEERDVLVCESGVNVRPGQFFTMEWALPEHYIREDRNASSSGHPDLVIGLVRYGEPLSFNLEFYFLMN